MNLGLTKEEIDAILKKGIDGPLKIDPNLVRNAITEAIIANNERILEQVKELLRSK